MSSVSGVGADSNTLSLVDLLNESKQEANSVLNSSVTLESSSQLLSSMRSRRAQNAYGGSAASATGQAALNRALSEMQTNGGKVTFKDIAEHREKLELEFSAQVRVDLAKLGVDLDTEFTLTMTPEGNIQVACDDPLAKETIQKYLSDNPEVCEQFGYIQALSNLERARQSPAGSMAAWQEVGNAKKEYQAQAVELFFSDALSTGMNYTSLLASFGASSSSTESSTSFYAGLDFTV